MRKVPKRNAVSEGDPTKPADVKKGTPLPAGAVEGPAPGAGTMPSGRILDNNGRVVGYYHIPAATAVNAGGQQTFTPPSDTTIPAATTPVPATPVSVPAPAPVLTREQQREAYKKALEGWKGGSAQKVPTEIASEIEKNIKPNVLANQAILDAATAKKYGTKGGPVKGQQLSYEEAAAALGSKEKYEDFLQDIYNYEGYRLKTKGTYDTQNVTSGATDPNEKMYGFRMSNMFKNTPEQSAANVKKTSQAVLDWQKNPVLAQKALENTPAPKTVLLDNNNNAIPEVKIGPDGKPLLPKVEKPVTSFKAGGKIPAGYKKVQKKAEGGAIEPDLSSLTPEQMAQFKQLGTPQLQNEFLQSLSGTGGAGAGAGMVAKSPTPDAKSAIASIPYAAAGEIAGTIVDKSVDVDPDNNRGEILKSAASTALKRAGTGAMLGSAFGPIGTAVGAGAGAVVGAVEGGIKGKKKAKAYDDQTFDENIAAAQNATYKLKDGGPIVGKGTSKSDSIKAEIKPGSFIVPAENAAAAEKIRKLYLRDSDKAKLKQPGGTPVNVSNGEHSFTPEEVAILEKRGVDLNLLAPNQESGRYGLQKGGEVPGYKDGGKIKDLSEDELKKKKAELQAEIDKMSGPGDNLAERSMLQAAKQKELDEINAEIKVRETEKQNTPAVEFSPEAVKNATANTSSSRSADAQKLLDDAFKNPNAGKEIPVANSSTSRKVTGATGGASGQGKGERELTPAEKAIQQTFVAEHATEAAPAPTTESGKQATSTNTIDNLKKEYDAAETLEDVERIRKQMHDLGYKSDGTPIMSQDARKAISGLGGDNIADNAAAEATVNNPDAAAAPQPSAIRRVYESLGEAGGLLAVGQIGAGIAMGMGSKLPVDKVDPNLKLAQQKAMQAATYGFTPDQMAYQRNQVEAGRRGVVGNVAQFSGGNAGTAIANTRLATIDANQANLAINSADASLKQQKQGYADNLTSEVARANRQVFSDSYNQYMLNQQSAAALINAGASNLSGAVALQNEQDRADERAQKYPSDPWAAIIQQRQQSAIQ